MVTSVNSGKKLLKVLHIEDDILMRKLIRRLLPTDVFTVEAAENGKKAIEILSEPVFRYDIIITEMLVTYTNGYEIVNLAQSNYGKHIPILVISNVNYIHIQDFVDIHYDNYFKKPLIIERFVCRMIEDIALSLIEGEAVKKELTDNGTLGEKSKCKEPGDGDIIIVDTFNKTSKTNLLQSQSAVELKEPSIGLTSGTVGIVTEKGTEYQSRVSPASINVSNFTGSLHAISKVFDDDKHPSNVDFAAVEDLILSTGIPEDAGVCSSSDKPVSVVEYTIEDNKLGRSLVKEKSGEPSLDSIMQLGGSKEFENGSSLAISGEYVIEAAISDDSDVETLMVENLIKDNTVHGLWAVEIPGGLEQDSILAKGESLGLGNVSGLILDGGDKWW